MLTRLKQRLNRAAAEDRGILLGFLPAGYPTPAGFRAAARAAFDAGIDALEVSMPGPAPELDGPIIQAAALQAADHLSGITEALQLAASSRTRPEDTIIAMAYARTFEGITEDAFLDELAAADVDALLLPQHGVADQLAVGLHAQERGIEPVVFLHRQEDLPLLAASEIDHPVIYLQSADLQTGGTFNPVKAAERLDELSEALADKPYSVCVGFGVRGTQEIAMLMAAGADGAIIGTRFVVAAGQGAGLVAAIVEESAPALVRGPARESQDVIHA